jgi:primosomal protein N' (replication factor Y)
MRAKANRADLILSSATLSLETYLAAKTKHFRLIQSKKSAKDKINIQILDMKEEGFRQRRKNLILSAFLENNIQNTISSGGKVMLFMNRKGFSTFIHCRACGYTLKCPRCNVGLVYHYDNKSLRCRFCNYSAKAVSICPNCQASYMRYLGLGTEKLESEMHRLFPQAKIKRWDKESPIKDDNFNILISTQIGLRKNSSSVELLGVLDPELSLSRMDFRAAEKTFSLLYRLSKLAKDKMIIQTYNPTHYCMQAIRKQDLDYFYQQELKQRKEFGFPPYKHLTQIILRGKNQERVKAVSYALFNKLNAVNKKKSIEVYEPSPSMPSKLRNNYYWNILLKGKSVKNICSLIRKPILEYKKKSAVITTVNVDL